MGLSSQETTANYDAVSAIQATIYLQDACWKHRFIRSKDTSLVPERPERLRAVILGLSVAIARLKEITKEEPTGPGDDLVASLERMNLASQSASPTPTRLPGEAWTYPACPLSLKHISTSADLFNHPAVKFVHGDIDGDVYLEKLRDMVRDSEAKIMKGESEIPEGLSQGDLYLCPTSLDAMQGAIGTICTAIDDVVASPLSSATRRAFVAIRPPGHHCGEDTPSGFCFLNNVAIGAAHAHLKYKIKRAVIFDIDLHHGNGTQSIAWQINEETYRKTLEREAGAPDTEGPGLQIYYGSLHDILSYPCEDGKLDLVQAASSSIHGPHGQYIENIHLERYESKEDFFSRLYEQKYIKLISKAEAFLNETGGPGEDVLIFISCGLDASEYEYDYMSRHGRNVPTSFFHRFTREACAFADKFARGRLISVLEGGYSDKALISGTMAHLCGLTDGGDEAWWSPENITQIESLIPKKRRGPRASQPTASPEPWLTKASIIYSEIEAVSPNMTAPPPVIRHTPPVAPSTRTLRERKPKSEPTSSRSTPTSSPRAVKTRAKPPSKSSAAPKGASINPPPQQGLSESSESSELSEDSELAELQEKTKNMGLGGGVDGNGKDVPKKLPRVILHVRPPPEQGTSAS